MEEIKKCDNCGFEASLFRKDNKEFPNHPWKVICHGCGQRTMRFKNPEDAINAFNRNQTFEVKKDFPVKDQIQLEAIGKLFKNSVDMNSLNGKETLVLKNLYYQLKRLNDYPNKKESWKGLSLIDLYGGIIRNYEALVSLTALKTEDINILENKKAIILKAADLINWISFLIDRLDTEIKKEECSIW